MSARYPPSVKVMLTAAVASGGRVNPGVFDLLLRSELSRSCKTVD